MRFARGRLWLIEMTCLLVGGLLVPTAFGGIVYNSKCQPMAMPVSTCGCPIPGIPNDLCAGAIPDQGTIYGDIACQPFTNTQCDSAPLGDGNPCGIVMMCPPIECNYNCNNPIITPAPPSCDCVPHPEKPPCTTRWGNCVKNSSPPPPPPPPMP